MKVKIEKLCDENKELEEKVKEFRQKVEEETLRVQKLEEEKKLKDASMKMETLIDT